MSYSNSYTICGMVLPRLSRGSAIPPSHCCQGIGYLLARSVLYEALAILAAAYPADVILVNHIQSIFSVYPHRDHYPPSNAQGYAVRRHDDAVLRGAVGAEDDGARVVHNSTAT